MSKDTGDKKKKKPYKEPKLKEEGHMGLVWAKSGFNPDQNQIRPKRGGGQG